MHILRGQQAGTDTAVFVAENIAAQMSVYALSQESECSQKDSSHSSGETRRGGVWPVARIYVVVSVVDLGAQPETAVPWWRWEWLPLNWIGAAVFEGFSFSCKC